MRTRNVFVLTSTLHMFVAMVQSSISLEWKRTNRRDVINDRDIISQAEGGFAP